MYIRLLWLIAFCSVTSWSWGTSNKEATSRKHQKEQIWTISAEDFLQDLLTDPNTYSPLDITRLDTLYKKRGIHINFTEEFAYRVLRQNDVENIQNTARAYLGLKKWQTLHITVDGLPLEQYVPVAHAQKKDKKRQDKAPKLQHVDNISKPYLISQGLAQRHIALWNSHGKYYNHQDSCWKWQRAPLFSTVEDLFTSTYVLPFLVPMLENADANVYLPRERDVQTNEVIVDNGDEGFSIQGNSNELNRGFKNGVLLYNSKINPFQEGESHILSKKTRATWQAIIPEKGRYAVYVSYAYSKKNTDEAKYQVHHVGGITTFQVNQQLASGTWVYLGHFDFDQEAKVQLVGKNANADAVRFGGGMGDIPREEKTSGVPRWQEAARYYLQYAGALDSVTYNRHGDTIDYNDDFRSRARWVNYLLGDKAIEPWLKNDKEIQGLHLPIDMSLGIHTDAGHFNGMDTTVGTLAIYSTYDVGKNRDFYLSKKSRLTNRDLADLLQSQIVEDIRALYDTTWTRRELWDKMYSEATFAQVPSMLLEIHGHANAQDMRYGLHPQFRFDVSRAMYKACLKFLSTYYKDDYIVQPLPVKELAIKAQGEHQILRWTPTLDPLEPTAAPTAYVVYAQKDGQGWDNGTLLNGTSYILPPQDEGVYTYKVTAVNAGGESFSSVALSMSQSAYSQGSILVIDGFTRVDAPAFMERGDSVGLAPWQDEGVAYGLDIGTIGAQYNYNQNDPWLSDEEPGHGGSSFELSDSLFLGNNFNTSYTYAEAISQLGYQVVSASAQAVEQGLVKLENYTLVVLAYGEQRLSCLPSGAKVFDILPSDMIDKLSDYLDQGGKMYINGAHLATSTLEGAYIEKNARQRFLKDYCGIAFATKVKPQHHRVSYLPDSLSYHYNVAHRKDYYRVENADAFLVQKGAQVLDRYSNGWPATVIKHHVLSSGVPFESIVSPDKRLELMKYYLEHLLNEDH